MAYLIILLAALFHAIWNSMIKESDDKLLTLGTIKLVSLFFGLAVITNVPFPDISVFPYLFATSLILYIYYFFLLNAYRLGDFSQVYPISRGLAPLIVLGLSVLIAKDSLSRGELVAVLLISLGVISLSFSKGKYSLYPLIFAVGTACTIAGYTFISGLGVRKAGSFLAYAGWLEAITGSGVIFYTIIKKKSHVLNHIINNWQHGLTAGILSVFAYSAALWAMTKIPIAAVAALRETSIIFASLIGTIYLKEGMTLNRVIAACVVVIGVAFLGT